MNNYRNQRDYENLQRKIFPGAGEYDIPYIYPTEYDGVDEWITFNQALTCKHPENKGVHFFIDDYQFNRVWKKPDAYIQLLSKFKYVTAPDFSLYSDFPKAMQIYNRYRGQWCGAYWQSEGVNIIANATWSLEDSFVWCFDGMPHNTVVAVSSIGCMADKETQERFMAGYNKMLEVLSPTAILFHGKGAEKCSGNIISMNTYIDELEQRKRKAKTWAVEVAQAD